MRYRWPILISLARCFAWVSKMSSIIHSHRRKPTSRPSASRPFSTTRLSSWQKRLARPTKRKCWTSPSTTSESASSRRYGIYEDGTPKRIAIYNYMDDPTGTNNVHAVISISGAAMPSSVKVKYLAAWSVVWSMVQKGNHTWAGQVVFICFAYHIGCRLRARELRV
ncbi:hypothetical protein DFH07DRAFT_851721 [Mycena maculata]|uniref:Beta-glucuronidase C-terminal domain-containing protein n=1 Tax=Mycena maculata TaxID=230809 RepID=A0AAD7HSR9_9AGAR|nr:hypothetical protein DFH07DRAFT_851721 [Mycena maculata]